MSLYNFPSSHTNIRTVHKLITYLKPPLPCFKNAAATAYTGELGAFRAIGTYLLAGSAINLSLLPNSDVSVCLTSLLLKAKKLVLLSFSGSPGSIWLFVEKRGSV